MSESALVVLVPAAEPCVGALRLRYDPVARLGMPAHVTLLHPFVDPREMTFSYQDGDSYVFMDKESYEELRLSADFLEGQSGYLLPNADVQVNLYNDRPIGIELPASVILTVTDTEPGIKNATATNTFKPATTETGLIVQVPPFINNGEKIKVSTADGSYMERA